MKPKFKSLLAAFTPLSCSSLVVCASLCAATSAHAQAIYKANNTDNLDAGTSWVDGVAPGTANIATWDNTVTGANLSNLQNSWTFGSMAIVDPGGPVQIHLVTGRTLSLASGGIDMSASTQDLYIEGNGYVRALNGNYIPGVNVATGKTFTMDGAIVNQGNTKTFTMSGGGNIIINSNSGSGGAMNFNIDGPTVTMNNAASGWTYGTVTSGKLVMGTGTVLDGKSLYMNSANGLELGTGVTTVSLGGLGGSGAIALDNVDTNPVALTIGSNNSNQTISGEISGAGSLTKLGTGTQTLTGTNSYLGGSAIQGGQVNLDSVSTTLGSAAVTLTNGSILRMFRGDATDNATYGTVFANELNIPTAQSGTVYNMPRGLWSGALTGDGTLNLRVNATRADFTGDWSAFTGQLNVTARTGNDDWRISNFDATINLSQASVDLAAGVNLYMVNHFYGTRTMQFGTPRAGETFPRDPMLADVSASSKWVPGTRIPPTPASSATAPVPPQ